MRVLNQEEINDVSGGCFGLINLFSCFTLPKICLPTISFCAPAPVCAPVSCAPAPSCEPKQSCAPKSRHC